MLTSTEAENLILNTSSNDLSNAEQGYRELRALLDAEEIPTSLIRKAKDAMKDAEDRWGASDPAQWRGISQD